jgi:hypothetical protein
LRHNTGFIHLPKGLAVVTPPDAGKSTLFLSTAKDLLRDHGEALVGRKVWTQRIGNWPGGLARVTKLYHDESAPDILFQVEGLEEQAKYPDGDKTIGVFDFEPCLLLTETE